MVLLQVLEMEKLLRRQQTESTSRRLELEQNLAQCQSDLQTRTQQLEQLTSQLSQSQKVKSSAEQRTHCITASFISQVAEQLQSKMAELQSAEQSCCSEREKQLLSKVSHRMTGSVRCYKLQWWLQDTELAVLRNRLQSLTESHSAVLASSEQLASTHRKTEAQVAEQLQSRQKELSRTRAQVSAGCIATCTATCT